MGLDLATQDHDLSRNQERDTHLTEPPRCPRNSFFNFKHCWPFRGLAVLLGTGGGSPSGLGSHHCFLPPSRHIMWGPFWSGMVGASVTIQRGPAACARDLWLRSPISESRPVGAGVCRVSLGHGGCLKAIGGGGKREAALPGWGAGLPPSLGGRQRRRVTVATKGRPLARDARAGPPR